MDTLDNVDGFEDQSKQMILRCTHVDGAEVCWDSKWYRLAHGEARRMPEHIGNKFMHDLPDRVVRVTGQEGTIELAKSNLEQAKKLLSQAQDSLAKAKDLVTQREKELKVAQARVDAETSQRATVPDIGSPGKK